MKTIFKLSESDIKKIIKKTVKEINSGDGEKDYFPEYEGRTDIYANSTNKPKYPASQQVKKPLVSKTNPKRF